MGKNSKKPWTTLERQILKDYYGQETVSELLERLPGRTENAIRKQVSYLRRRGWRFDGIRRRK